MAGPSLMGLGTVAFYFFLTLQKSSIFAPPVCKIKVNDVLSQNLRVLIPKGSVVLLLNLFQFLCWGQKQGSREVLQLSGPFIF